MISVKTKVTTTPRNVTKAVDKAAFKNFRHAGFGVRKTAAESVKTSNLPTKRRKRGSDGQLPPKPRKRGKPGPAGGPVTTRGNAGNVRGAYFSDATKDDAIIGPRFSFVGESQYYQEFGETIDGMDLEERPTSHLALEANVDRFARDWEGSVGE